MKPDYDLTFEIGEEGPCAFVHTDAGEAFMKANLDKGPLEMLSHIPPGLRVGLLSPETNIFAQPPCTVLH